MHPEASAVIDDISIFLFKTKQTSISLDWTVLFFVDFFIPYIYTCVCVCVCRRALLAE